MTYHRLIIVVFATCHEKEMHQNSKALETQLEKIRELEHRLTFRLSVVSKQLDQEAQQLLQDTPINLSSYRIMNVVSTFEQISISDISRYTLMDRAQVSRAAVQLDALGLVGFRGDPESKRKKLVFLTTEGQALLDDIRPAFDQRRLALEALLGAEDLACLWRVLDKFP